MGSRPIQEGANNRIQKIEVTTINATTETVCLEKIIKISIIGTSTKTDVTENAKPALAWGQIHCMQVEPNME